MAGRRKYFPYNKDGVRYDFTKVSAPGEPYAVHVDAVSNEKDEKGKPIMSSAVFEHEPDLGMFVVRGGTLDLHPIHRQMGVGVEMGKAVNNRYLRHMK